MDDLHAKLFEFVDGHDSILLKDNILRELISMLGWLRVLIIDGDNYDMTMVGLSSVFVLCFVAFFAEILAARAARKTSRSAAEAHSTRGS